MVVPRCFLHPLTCTHSHPSHKPFRRLRVEVTPKHTQTKQHTQAHTFPGGDKSCKQLAEVSPGVCVFVAHRSSFQLGGRAPVSQVGLSQAVGVSLKESYLGKTNSRCQRWKLSAVLMNKLAAGKSYLQKEQRGSAGPHPAAERRRGAPDSSYTGLPARHTHTALQSSETQREKVK